MIRQLLHNATVLTVDAADRVIENGWLVIEDDRIAGLGGPADKPALSDSEIDDIVAFLGTLTDGYKPR